MLNVTEIMERIPHRYPFLLVDRIIEMEEGKRIVGIKNVTMNEEFFQGHFPGNPVMPGVLMVEGFAQTLGILVMEPGMGKTAYFASIENAKFRKPVVPGDQLVYEVEIEKMRRSMVKANAVAKVDGNVVASATIMCSIG